MEKLLLFAGVFTTVLLMVSAATAVPVNNGREIINNIDKINNTKESNKKIFEKIKTGVVDGIIGLIIQLINLTIQIILQVINVVQSVLGIINLIKNLINGLQDIFQLIQDIIDIITGNEDPQGLLV